MFCWHKKQQRSYGYFFFSSKEMVKKNGMMSSTGPCSLKVGSADFIISWHNKKTNFNNFGVDFFNQNYQFQQLFNYFSPSYVHKTCLEIGFLVGACKIELNPLIIHDNLRCILRLPVRYVLGIWVKWYIVVFDIMYLWLSNTNVYFQMKSHFEMWLYH